MGDDAETAETVRDIIADLRWQYTLLWHDSTEMMASEHAEVLDRLADRLDAALEREAGK